MLCMQAHGDWEQIQVKSYINSAGICTPGPSAHAQDIPASHDSASSIPQPCRAPSGAPGKPLALSHLACFGLSNCSSSESCETYRRNSSELTVGNLRLHALESSTAGSSTGPYDGIAVGMVGELSSAEAATQAESIASSDWSLSSISTTLSDRARQLLRGPPSILSCIMESEPAGFTEFTEPGALPLRA